VLVSRSGKRFVPTIECKTAEVIVAVDERRDEKFALSDDDSSLSGRAPFRTGADFGDSTVADDHCVVLQDGIGRHRNEIGVLDRIDAARGSNLSACSDGRK